MRGRIIITLLTLVIFTSPACEKNEKVSNLPSENSNNQTEEKKTVYRWEKERKELLNYNDMVLLYAGGSHRPYSWDVNYISPYVTYVDENGKEHWLFDSFLFLEIHNGNGKTFATGYTKTPANQDDWTNLVNHYFHSCTGSPIKPSTPLSTE